MDLATHPTEATGIHVLADQAAVVKGAWTTLNPSIPTSIEGFWLTWGSFYDGVLFQVDIAIGAPGAETIIIPDLFFQDHMGGSIYYPIAMPKGTRISARTQATLYGAIDATIQLTGKASTFMADRGGPGRCITTSDNQSFDPGPTVSGDRTRVAAKGSWVEMFNSTPYPIRHLQVMGLPQDTTTEYASFLVDIGVGSPNGETTIIPNIWFNGSYAAGGFGVQRMQYTTFEIEIPAGSRIVSRCGSESLNPGAGDLWVGLWAFE